MHLDQKITVTCTDNDTKSNGKIIRIFPNGIDIEVSGTIIKLKKTMDAQKRLDNQKLFRAPKKLLNAQKLFWASKTFLGVEKFVGGLKILSASKKLLGVQNVQGRPNNFFGRQRFSWASEIQTLTLSEQQMSQTQKS